MKTIPKIYPITDTRISGLSHLEQVRRLISGGASFIQLRDKAMATGEFYRAAVEAVDHARDHGVRIIINDRVDIALASGAAGVHLGQDDLPPTHARNLLGPEAIIGFSTHSIAQACEAIELPIDYIAIGPIFPTSTKLDHDFVVGLSGLRNVRALMPEVPLVAIGGINRANVASVFEAGGECVALVSDIISEPSKIAERMREFLRAADLKNDVGNV